MKVSELVEHLKTLPQDYEVHFRGYSCGSTWHCNAGISDFIVVNHIDTGEEIVEITADWN